MDLSYLTPVFQSVGLTTEQVVAIRSAILDEASHAELGNSSARTLTRTLQLDPVNLDTTVIVQAEEGHTLNHPIESTKTEVENVVSTSNTLDGYDDLGLLGKGGMGEVRRVRDRELNRKLAMKIIHPELLDKPATIARFVEEAQICAQLQHPNIVPVHEMGQLPDHRLYFTMHEIQGREFTKAIQDVHAAIQHARWFPTADGWNFHRLMDVFHQVCNAVAYAHAKGVVHRDLKPENIMLGAFGEVLVVDWGIAKVQGRPDLTSEFGDLEHVSTHRSEKRDHATRMGQIAGTPAYMAPEQAKGQIHRIDARTDVYALGSILYEILSGHAPFAGTSAHHVLQQLLSGPPVSLRTSPNGVGGKETLSFDFIDNVPLSSPDAGPPLPNELVSACERAMARNPEDRYQTAAAMATDIEAWLEGARKREQALEVVKKALATEEEAQSLWELASRLRKEGEAELKEIRAWESELVKSPHWKVIDEATGLEQKARLLGISREQLLKGALTHKSDLSEAHEVLAWQYRREHKAAEEAYDASGTKQAEVRLLEHAEFLPWEHPDRSGHFAYLKGVGALTLTTQVPDVEVLLEKYEQKNRRLIPISERSLGKTPMFSVPLAKGSYRLRLRKGGHHELLYPVFIGRGHHWDGVPPKGPSGSTVQTLNASVDAAYDGSASMPIFLLRLGSLGPDECYIPSGWFLSGGDPHVSVSLPRQRVWIDGFAMRRFPVTNREYLFFLNDLLAQNREEEALQWVPRERIGQVEQQASMIYGRTRNGDFCLTVDADGDKWALDWPVMMIDWHCAGAYAKWQSERDGLPWRLPDEFEWEKAARGVDGRFFPWGSFFDPSWSCIRDSHPGRVLPVNVDSFPVDESPYGVRGLGGNIRDWTQTIFAKKGPVVFDGRVQRQEEKDLMDADRVYRGGYWGSYPNSTRTSYRDFYSTITRLSNIGFRLVRSIS